MRRLPLLLIVAVLVIVGVVANSYYHRKLAQVKAAPPAPPRIEDRLSAKANAWSWNRTENGRVVVEVKADSMLATKDASQIELEGVEILLHHKDDQAFDKVQSAKALFNVSDGVMFSDGEVGITLGVPETEPGKEHLLKIVSSGVRYESKTGKATTDRAARFDFDRGSGKGTGINYDPATRELHLLKDVELHWRGKKPGTKPMMVQAGELTYKEAESKVYLSPWSKLIRDTLTLNAAASTVTLVEGEIRLVEASQAHGVDMLPDKKLDYAADQLNIEFGDGTVVEKITGSQNARLVSQTKAAVTTVTADLVTLGFRPAASGSELQRVDATGKVVSEAKPIPRPGAGAVLPDTRILRSEAVQMDMRPGGQEIDFIQTHAPGTIEFLPNRPEVKRRKMDGERLTILYGPENQIRSFKALNVATRTENAPQKGKPVAPALTWSKDLTADFDPRTGDLMKLEQTQDFRYEEGDRKAKADRAILDQPNNIITLQGASRVWDPTGSTAADRIVMNQRNSDTQAEGNVVSVRQPDKKGPQKADTSLLSQNEPLQAKAQQMITRENNLQVHYEGNAFLWQGVNRLQADVIDIDRKNGYLSARGKVVSQLVDKQAPEETPGGAAKKPSAAPVFTVVHAPEMTYSDKDRLAHYKGGVVLNRTGLDVKSQELRAFLAGEEEGGSSLDHAFADGKVDIFQRAPARTRQGLGEHAEYYVDDEKIFLQGGQPVLIDSIKGTTRGRQLTYFVNNERLIVDGEASKPAFSRIKRKK